MDRNKRLPTLRVYARDLSSHALVVGDPQRAADAARLLNKPEEIANFREFRTFTGEYAGKRITICSHGIGSAGASVCFDELFRGGVQTVIRAGTCGAMVEDIQDGELVVATGAIREDGTTPQLVPLAYPAVADRHVIAALEAAAKRHTGLHVGLVLTQAHFYPGLLPSTLDLWQRAGALCVEMELAALLVAAGLHGVRAGGIFTSDGNVARDPDPYRYNPHRDVVSQGIQTMLGIALEALSRLP